MKNTIILILVILISGCYSSRKASYQVQKAQEKYPTTVAQICAAFYPSRVYDSISVKYLPGKIDTIPGESVYVNCDSITKAGSTNSTKVKVDCPPTYRRVDTVYSDHWRQVTDSAATFLLTTDRDSWKTKYDQQSTSLSSTKSKLFWWRLVALSLILGIILRIGIKIFLAYRNKIL